MIWATFSSWFHLCWLYRASPFLAANNIINLSCIDHLVMSMCRIIFCVVGRGCLLWAVCSLGKTLRLCPASFCIPRPNWPVIPGISWLPTFTFQLSFFGISCWKTDLDYSDIEWFALEMNRDHSVVFEIVPKDCISNSCWLWGWKPPFLLRDSCPQ